MTAAVLSHEEATSIFAALAEVQLPVGFDSDADQAEFVVAAQEGIEHWPLFARARGDGFFSRIKTFVFPAELRAEEGILQLRFHKQTRGTLEVEATVNPELQRLQTEAKQVSRGPLSRPSALAERIYAWAC